jgi:hypothetical protein
VAATPVAIASLDSRTEGMVEPCQPTSKQGSVGYFYFVAGALLSAGLGSLLV